MTALPLPFTTTDTPASAGKPRRRKPKAKPVEPPAPVAPSAFLVRTKLALTIALGVAMPLLSLTLSRIAGNLALTGTLAGYALGAFALGLCVSVLTVSLAHLAWAIRDVTGSGWRSSWALAVTIDLALVAGELVQVLAAKAGLALVTGALMTAVCGFSMVLNCWAFCCHKEAMD